MQLWGWPNIWWATLSVYLIFMYWNYCYVLLKMYRLENSWNVGHSYEILGSHILNKVKLNHLNHRSDQKLCCMKEIFLKKQFYEASEKKSVRNYENSICHEDFIRERIFYLHIRFAWFELRYFYNFLVTLIDLIF